MLDDLNTGLDTGSSLNLWRVMNPEFDRCLEAAKKFNNATEWRRRDKKTYFLAKELDYLEKIFRAMRWKTSPNWTLTICLRIAQQFNSLSEWRKSAGYSHRAYIVACNEKWIVEIRERLGWNRKKHTFESCMKAAQQFNSPSEWCNSTGNNHRAYVAACIQKWLPEIRQQLGWEKKHTFESCMKAAEKYPHAAAWKESKEGATYRAAYVNRWLKNIALELGWSICRDWTIEKCLEVAKSYKTSSEWSRSTSIDRKAYIAACQNKWLDEIKLKLNWKKEYKRTYEECKEAASKFTRMVDWVKNDHPTYQFSCKRKWHRQIAKELGWAVKNNGKRKNSRTYEECQKEALPFNGLVEWWRGEPASYAYATRRKWHWQIARELGWKHRGKAKVPG